VVALAAMIAIAIITPLLLLLIGAGIWWYLRDTDSRAGERPRRKGFDLEAAEGGSNDNWLEDNSRTFDYIVVGAGSSGCALVSRLVRGGKSVLVLVDGSSASSENRLVATMRSWWRAASSRSSVVSAFETRPQKGLGGRRLPVWVGRGGGGSGNLCATLWLRGRREDYERHWPWDMARIDSRYESDAPFPLGTNRTRISPPARYEPDVTRSAWAASRRLRTRWGSRRCSRRVRARPPRR
jgi:hypothetical protein